MLTVLIVSLQFTMGYILKFSHTLRDATAILLPQYVSQACLSTLYIAIKQSVLSQAVYLINQTSKSKIILKSEK